MTPEQDAAVEARRGARLLTARLANFLEGADRTEPHRMYWMDMRAALAGRGIVVWGDEGRVHSETPEETLRQVWDTHLHTREVLAAQAQRGIPPHIPYVPLPMAEAMVAWPIYRAAFR